MAAGLCKKYNTNPRGIYRDHLEEFTKILGKSSINSVQTDEITISKLDAKLLRTSLSNPVVDLPAELQGAQCVTVERGEMGWAGAGYQFAVDRPVAVYMAVHTRGGFIPQEPWKLTSLTLKWDKGDDEIYSAEFPAGTIAIPSHTGKEGHYYGLPNMAIVVPESGQPGDLKITPVSNR
jgi:hypothetical protein